MDQFYYVTVAAGTNYIKNEAQYALRSLLKTGVAPENVHCVVQSKTEQQLVCKLVSPDINVHVLKEDLSSVVWKYQGGKRIC